VSISAGSRDLKYGELDGIRGDLNSEDSKLDNDEDPVKKMNKLDHWIAIECSLDAFRVHET
jgi:hypothetical protein